MNNEFLQLIKERRSIRKFKQEQISKEKLDMIIEAGLYAPSAVNSQPWHFTVIQNQDIINDFNKDLKEILKDSPIPAIKNLSKNENYHFFHNAPTLILVSGEDAAYDAKTDIAIASQNIMLAAHAVGLGSCWIGFANYLFNSPKKDEYIEKLEIPKGYSPSHVIIIGEKDNDLRKAPARRENTVNYIR